jgi:hypothetical protein
MWIDCEEKHGTLGYLVETLNTNTGRTTFSLYERPCRTNQSLEPRLWGWCGETDNRSRYARGVVRVVKRNRLGDRARVAQVTGVELAAFLESEGYPDLA